MPTIPGESAPSTDPRVILFVAGVGAFVTPFMGASLNIALPAIGSEFAMSAVALGWVATTYILATAALLVPFGKIADNYGRKKVYLWGTIIFSVASLLCGLSPTSTWLLVFRGVQGAGAALIFGTAVAILTSAFPPEKRGRALGINVAAVYVGLSVGPLLGGVLTERLGWRSIFFVAAVLGIGTASLMLWKVKEEWLAAVRSRFDLPGSLMYAAALVGITWGLSELPGAPGAVVLALGIAGLLAFVWWETRTPTPVLDMHLFRHNRVFAFSNLAALISYSATFAVGFLLSLYLQEIKGLTPETAGLVLMAQPILMAGFSPFAGRLSDRIEPRVVASTGMSLTVVALLFFSFLGPQTPLGGVIPALAVLGLGLALFSSPNTNTIMSSVSPEYYGVAAATTATMRMVGQMLSMALAMLAFALTIGRVEITPEVQPAFISAIRITFAVFTGLCVIGTLASLARGNLRGGVNVPEPP
jgi:EmrB/QacA subfamily drug resistance transporter